MWELLLLFTLASVESKIAEELLDESDKHDTYGHGRCFSRTWDHLQRVSPVESDPAVYPS